MKKIAFKTFLDILRAYKRPVIGFDIDDVLADLGPILVSELNKRGYGVSEGDRDKAKWEMSSTKPIPSSVMNEIFDNLIASGDLAKIPTIPNVKKILDECKVKGARIILITARPEKLMGELTKEWLRIQGLPYDALYFAKDKKAIANKEKVDLFIDDDIVNAFDDRVVILDKPWNKDWKGNKINSLEQISESVDKISKQPEDEKLLSVALVKSKKVVAENKSLYLYHGTPRGGYSSFSGPTFFAERATDAKQYAIGSPMAAQRATIESKGSPEVLRVKVDIGNVFDVSRKEHAEVFNQILRELRSNTKDPDLASMYTWMPEYSLAYRSSGDKLSAMPFPLAENKIIQKKLMELGFNSIRVSEGSHTSYLVFDPSKAIIDSRETLTNAVYKLKQILVSQLGPTVYILPKAVLGLGNSDYIATAESIEIAAGMIATQEDIIEKFLKEKPQYRQALDLDQDISYDKQQEGQQALEEWVKRVLQSWAIKVKTHRGVNEYYRAQLNKNISFEDLQGWDLVSFDRLSEELTLIYTSEHEANYE